MKNLAVAAALTLASVLCAGTSNAATYTYVGSWQVDEGPRWTESPLAYTGKEVAALLFGGSPNDYAISTINDMSLINFSTWISTWGGTCGGTFPCGSIVADDFKISTFYLNEGDVSAFVNDWAIGSEYTNYVFAVQAVPGPEAGAGLAGLAMAGFGAYALRRRRQAAS